MGHAFIHCHSVCKQGVPYKTQNNNKAELWDVSLLLLAVALFTIQCLLRYPRKVDYSSLFLQSQTLGIFFQEEREDKPLLIRLL